MFTPSIMLQKYLNSRPRNIYDITGALMGYINADPEFITNSFDDAIKYVLNNGISEKELYKEFDPDYSLEEDESKWDDAYYSYARVYLKDNFCRKRIEHVKKVARKLYPSPNTGIVSMAGREQSCSEPKKTAQSQERRQGFEKKPTFENNIKNGGLLEKIEKVVAKVKDIAQHQPQRKH